MRKILVETLCELAQNDKRIMLLTGDLGYTVLEPFAENFPDRFYNMGVAEQNMIGVATGLAEAGYIPFVYSIATFASLRAYEFIRNGPVWHQLPVRIVGTGGGTEYGLEGLSHYALEDVGIMRMQPDLMVVVPADTGQAQTALRKTWNVPGPIYYRISKRKLGRLPNLRNRFSIGKLQVIREGQQVLFLTLGTSAHETWLAAEELARQKISAGIGVISCISPAPVKQLKKLLGIYKYIITVEAHYATGGIGSLVAEIIAEGHINCRLFRCGVKNLPRLNLGQEEYLWKTHRISAQKLVQLCQKLLSGQE